MNKQELEAWLETHHYPQLVLGTQDVVRHGEWNELLADTSGRIEQALERIETFMERVERERTSR